MRHMVRRLLLALALTLGLSTAVTLHDALPASAWTANCVSSPSSSSGAPSYGGAWCVTNQVGGTLHRVAINCKYVLFGISHTYWVYGPAVGEGDWSWAYCGNHYKDGPNSSRPDWVIHLNIQFNPCCPSPNSSGSW